MGLICLEEVIRHVERGLDQRVKRDALDSPISQLADVECVGAAAIDRVGGAEFLGQFARDAELAQNLAVQLHAIDFAAVGVRAIAFTSRLE